MDSTFAIVDILGNIALCAALILFIVACIVLIILLIQTIFYW